MAEWRNRRVRIKTFLGLLKDHLEKGLAFATSTFAGMHIAVLMATSHEECLPEEKHVQTILSAGTGSRVRVAFCVRALVKRLQKTRKWAVALKCLVVIHRTLHEGGFLFQDHLAALANGGRDFLNLSNFKDDSGPLAWALSSWVRRYAHFLDERLICCKVVGSFLDSKGRMSRHVGERVPYLATEELLEDISALQSLLKQAFECEVDRIAAENELILEALRLVVRDSYLVQEELSFRIKEMMARSDVLRLAEALQLLHVCRKASEQTERLVEYCELCEATGISEACKIPERIEFSDLDLKKVNQAIKAASTQPSMVSLLRAETLSRHTGTTGRFSFSSAPEAVVQGLRRSRSSSEKGSCGFRAQSSPASQINGVSMRGVGDKYAIQDKSAGLASSRGDLQPGAVVPLENLLPMMPPLNSYQGYAVQQSLEVPHRSSQGNGVGVSDVRNSKFPVLHESPSPLAGKTSVSEGTEWESTLLESLKTLDFTTGPSHLLSWSQGGISSAGTSNLSSTTASHIQQDSTGTTEGFDFQSSIPASQSQGGLARRHHRLSLQHDLVQMQRQQQPTAGPLFAPQTRYPDYFAGVLVNGHGRAAPLPR